MKAIYDNGLSHPWQTVSGMGISFTQIKLLNVCKKMSGIDNWILTDCGTDSLSLAILTVTEPNDLILVPAYGWISAANSVSILNRRIRFIDIDETGNFDPNCLKEYLRHEEIPTAIIIIHSFGTIVDCKAISRITSEYDIKIIEDVAQAFIVDEQNMYNYIPGQLSDIVCYSFDFTKLPGTLGSGGGIATNNDKYKDKLFTLANLGASRDKEFVSFGIKSYMDNISCAILLKEMELIIRYNLRSAKREIALWYDNNLPYKKIKGDNYINARYVIIVPNQKEIISKLWDNRIFANTTKEALIPNIVEYYKTEDQFPVAEWFSKNTVQLPCHPFLSEKDLDRIKDVLDKC